MDEEEENENKKNNKNKNKNGGELQFDWVRGLLFFNL